MVLWVYYTNVVPQSNEPTNSPCLRAGILIVEGRDEGKVTLHVSGLEVFEALHMYNPLMPTGPFPISNYNFKQVK